MQKISAIDWATVAKLLAGGALTGAGLGAGTSLVRQLQALNEKAQASKDTAYDDDVLYLHLPSKQQPAPAANRRNQTVSPKFASTVSPDANSVGTFAIGSLAGLAGTFGAYNLVRHIYQKARKKQLQKELDAAQNIYIGNLGTTSKLQKQASQFSNLTKGIGTGYLGLILSAIGSGIVANRMLQKQFPPLRNPQRDRPRKIVLETDNPTEAKTTETNVSPDAVESLVRTELANPKVAYADCGLADMVAAIAQGRGYEAKNNLAFSVDMAFEAVKGARHQPTSTLNQNLAITWMCTDPLVKEALAPVIAAEFYDMAPGIAKIASYVDREYHEGLVKVAEASVQETRKAIYARIMNLPQMQKCAESGEGTGLDGSLLAQALQKLLSLKTDKGEKTNDVPMHTNTTPSVDSPDMSASRKGLPAYEVQDDEALKFKNRYGPMLDSLVARS